MKLIKIKANSIHSALAEARREYGNDVMLIESRPTDENGLAEIVIALEAPKSSARRASAHNPVGRLNGERRTRGATHPLVTPQHATVEAMHEESFSEQLSNQMVPDAAEAARQLSEAFGGRRTQPGHADNHATSGDNAMARGSISLDRSSDVSRRRTFAPRLMNAAGRLAERLVGDRSLRGASNESVNRSSRSNRVAEALSEDVADTPSVPSLEPDTIKSLGIRLRSIEQSLSGSSIAFANRWISHPLYAAMTTKGYSAETTIGVLSTLASRGVPPNADVDYLRARVFEEMRRRNRTVIANTRTGRHVFVGTPGSGKTNLILKIANDASTRAAGRTIVLTMGQPNGNTAPSTSAYAQAGVESLHIHSAQQLTYSLEVLSRYETILIDTPASSSSTETADNQFRQIAATLEPLDMLTVHYVIDVRRNLDDVADDIETCGLSVDALALSNLDGLRRPGLLIDFLERHDQPVFFASSAPYESGNGLDRFIPVDLLASSLGLEEWPYSENELSDYFRVASTRSGHQAMNFSDSTTLRPMGPNGRV